MCGIVGIFRLDGQPIEATQLRHMADLLRHRGPDDEGFALFNTAQGYVSHYKGPDSPKDVPLTDIRSVTHTSTDLGLAERRLAILDLSPAGHTPLTDSTGELTIVFNGEIYNYVELRAELMAHGYRFRSSGDTEVLLAAYHLWGEACLERLNGMWAFAIWDSRYRRLFCARDRFGVKPFYYVKTPSLFAFASEPKALWASGLVSPECNEVVLEDFLAGYEASSPEATFFQHIRQLPPAHWLRVSQRDFHQQRFWSLPVNTELGPEKLEERHVQTIRQLLIDSVRLRLRSDVPVGTCLSGGLDSSSIVAIVNHLMKQEHGIAPVAIGEHQKTFTAAYEEPSSDERHFARLVVEQTGAQWYQVFPTAESLVEDLDRFVWHHDEPPITTSMYAQWCVMRLVRQQSVTVVLDGQGSDELLGGYLPYEIYLAQILDGGQWGRFLRESWSISKVGSRSLRAIFPRIVASYMPPSWQNRAQSWRSKRMFGVRKEVVARATERHTEIFNHATRHNLNLHLAHITAYNLPRLLRAEDRNSMAFSVEAREPFLDVHLAEYISQLPATYRIYRGWSKYALRRAMQPLLPEAIIWRRDKKGFVTPEARWMIELRSFWNDYIGDKPYIRPWLDWKQAQQFLQGRQFQTLDPAQAASIWRWVAAETWMRQTGSK